MSDATAIPEFVESWLARVARGEYVTIDSSECPALRNEQREIISELRRRGVLFNLHAGAAGILRLCIMPGSRVKRRARR